MNLLLSMYVHLCKQILKRMKDAGKANMQKYGYLHLFKFKKWRWWQISVPLILSMILTIELLVIITP